jgi:hypothetical protein
MALKFRYQSKEEVPAEHLPFYVERDGAFVLDAEGAVEKSKLDEFRQNNVALLKQVEEFKSRFAGIDPEEYRKLSEEKRKAEEERLLSGQAAPPNASANAEREKIEKVVENRVKALRAELEKQVSTLTSERDALTSRLVEIEINQGVIVAATKRGLRPTAIPDVVGRAHKVFQLVNGVPTAFEKDGKTVRYGRDGISPLTLDEWAEGLVAEAPHLFESNAGGGAAGNASGGGARGSVKNPFRKESWNVTEQMRLLKADPQLAGRLKAAA